MSGPARPGDNDGPLAIICGGGPFPLAVAEAVKRRGRDVVFIGTLMRPRLTQLRLD